VAKCIITQILSALLLVCRVGETHKINRLALTRIEVNNVGCVVSTPPKLLVNVRLLRVLVESMVAQASLPVPISWIPAFAGMTKICRVGETHKLNCLAFTRMGKRWVASFRLHPPYLICVVLSFARRRHGTGMPKESVIARNTMTKQSDIAMSY